MVSARSGGRYHHHSLYGSHAVPPRGVLFRLRLTESLRAAFGRDLWALDPDRPYCGSEAAEIRAVRGRKGEMVAGAGFEPATFGL